MTKLKVRGLVSYFIILFWPLKNGHFNNDENIVKIYYVNVIMYAHIIFKSTSKTSILWKKKGQ